jgi:translation initiation factor 1A
MQEEFKDINETEKQEEDNKEQKIIRVRLPRKKEVLGIIEQRLGGNKMMINCLDGKTRNCRVPGRLKRRLWLRPNDIVIVEPWELDNNRGDIIFKYRTNEIELLRKNGYLDKEKVEF